MHVHAEARNLSATKLMVNKRLAVEAGRPAGITCSFSPTWFKYSLITSAAFGIYITQCCKELQIIIPTDEQ